MNNSVSVIHMVMVMEVVRIYVVEGDLELNVKQ